MRPSFLGLVLGGLLIGLAAVAVVIHYRKLGLLPVIYILLLASIAISAHSVLHFYEEVVYNWNPLVGKWRVTA